MDKGYGIIRIRSQDRPHSFFERISFKGNSLVLHMLLFQLRYVRVTCCNLILYYLTETLQFVERRTE